MLIIKVRNSNMNKLVSILSNVHTWVVTAAVVSAGLSEYVKLDSPTGIVASIISVALMVCAFVINHNQVQVAAAGAPVQA